MTDLIFLKAIMKAKRVINKISTGFTEAHEIKEVSRVYEKHTFYD